MGSNLRKLPAEIRHQDIDVWDARRELRNVGGRRETYERKRTERIRSSTVRRSVSCIMMMCVLVMDSGMRSIGGHQGRHHTWAKG